MSTRVRTQIVRCQNRKRDVEVSYTVSGRIFARVQDIVNCPAMHDGSASCNRQCRPLLGRAPGYLDFATNIA